MLYGIEFTGDIIKYYSVNIIVNKIYAQVDAEVHVYNIMEEILYYNKDASYIDIEDRYITTKSDQHRMRQKILERN